MKNVALIVAIWIAACFFSTFLMPRRHRVASFVALTILTFGAWYLWPQVAEGVSSPCGAAIAVRMGDPSNPIGAAIAEAVGPRMLAAVMRKEHPDIPVGLQCAAAFYRYRYR